MTSTKRSDYQTSIYWGVKSVRSRVPTFISLATRGREWLKENTDPDRVGIF
ncbi:hypothetical protein GO755_31420 [Spirosoma sp. HMF4905]|uniref:Uncharacterized protein n=1 Tax=Spirosoma arboris TaxID=2682092 RepID=A0A7K1SL97_9BACT|nr:hypothetical protein [Spirosoma arboris]MVM34581.1 hypothetical protein [Spirosoma arboris]